MEPRHQVYIDPSYVNKNILQCNLWWDHKTSIKVQVTFEEGRVIGGDRHTWIGFMAELLRRNDIDLVMDKNSFINMHFNEIKGLDVKILKVEF